MDQVRVAVRASDPMTYAGLTSYLSSRDQLTVISQKDEQPDVVVFSADRLNHDTMTRLRQTAGELGAPTVLMIGELSDLSLLPVVESRVVAILPKTAITGDQLVDSVLAAARGGGVMPRDVLGTLLRQIESLQREVLAPNGLNASGLQPREVSVLRLIADGWSTDMIAQELRYSERTVKNVIYHLTTRLKLRNRAHAVAFALRSGVI